MNNIYPFLMAKDLKEHPNKLIRNWPLTAGVKSRYAWQSPAPWIFLTYTAKSPAYNKRHRIRDEYHRKDKEQFTKQAKKWLRNANAYTLNKLDWNVHHIFPVSLGGDNRHLVICQTKMHEKIHEFIKAQTTDMKRGEERDVLVPFSPELVWATPFYTRANRTRKRGASSVLSYKAQDGKIIIEPTIKILQEKPSRKQRQHHAGKPSHLIHA